MKRQFAVFKNTFTGCVLRSLFFLFFVAGLSSCCLQIEDVVQEDPIETRLAEGVQLFEQGEYEKAQDVFEEVMGQAENFRLKGRVVYNLACIRLLRADTLKEMKKAAELLDGWQKTHGKEDAAGSPILAIAALENQVIVLEKEVRKRLGQQRQARKIIATQEELVKKLQHQISELEAIDKQLQEKKNPL